MPPFLNVFASILGNNGFLTILISLWVVFVIPFALGSNVRYLFLAGDARLGLGRGRAEARSRMCRNGRHTPVFAIVTLVVLAEVALGYLHLHHVVAILSGFLGFAIAFLVVCVTGIFFPFTHRQTMERSPANIKVAGIPLMTICGALAVPFIASSHTGPPPIKHSARTRTSR